MACAPFRRSSCGDRGHGGCCIGDIPLSAALVKNTALQITLASETALNDPKKYPNLYSTGAGLMSVATEAI